MTGRIEAPTKQEFDQAMKVIHPDDRATLLELSDQPDAYFSLARPITSPTSQPVSNMQANVTEDIRNHPHGENWTIAAVKLPEYVGATYLDGDPIAIAQGEPFLERISGFALATKMLAALPKTATKPVTATVEKIVNGSPLKRRIYTTIGLLCVTAQDEMHSTHAISHPFLFANATLPSKRVPAHLAYIYEAKEEGLRKSSIPVASLKETISRTMPEGSTVELAPVRLFMHPAGTSPYTKIKG